MQEIPELAGVAAYWVNSAACVDVARNKITHKLAQGELIETEPWLKDGPITIGVPPALLSSRPLCITFSGCPCCTKSGQRPGGVTSSSCHCSKHQPC